MTTEGACYGARRCPAFLRFICPKNLATNLSRVSYDVVFVFDGQSGVSSHPDIADGLVLHWKPKALHFPVFVMNLAFFSPERRVFSGLGFDSSNGEICAAHPHSTAIDVLTTRLWVNAQEVSPAGFRGLVPDEYKIVIVAIQLRLRAHSGLRGFFLAF